MSPDSGRASGTGRGALALPLDLIHTNNCSKPVSMRLPEGFALIFGTGNHPTHAAVLGGPVGHLLLSRRAYGK